MPSDFALFPRLFPHTVIPQEVDVDGQEEQQQEGLHNHGTEEGQLENDWALSAGRLTDLPLDPPPKTSVMLSGRGETG